MDLPAAWARCHGNRCLFASWSSRGGPTRRKSSPTSAPLEPWTWRLFKCAVSATRVCLCAVPARLRLQLARGVSPSLPCLHLANASFCQRLCANSTQAGFASAISSAARQASTLAKPRTIRACHRASSSQLARVTWHEKKNVRLYSLNNRQQIGAEEREAGLRGEQSPRLCGSGASSQR